MLQSLTLSLDDAKRVAAAARAEAKKSRWAVVIVVVDDGGHLMHLPGGRRTEGIEQHRLEKGRTAILFKRPTRAIEQTVLEDRVSILGLPQAVPPDGGVPLVNERPICRLYRGVGPAVVPGGDDRALWCGAL
jgi:glc operon protein GlcG